MPEVSETSMTKSEKSAARQKMFEIGEEQTSKDIFYMLKSRFRILYICTPEEVRVIDYFRHMAASEGFSLYQWDCSRGLLDGFSKEPASMEGSETENNPMAILAHIIDQAKTDFVKIAAKKKGSSSTSDGSIYLLLDFHRFFADPDRGLTANPIIERQLKEFSQIVSMSMIVIIAPELVCPPTLEKEITVIDFPFPSKKEVKRSLAKLVKEIPAKYPSAIKVAKEKEEEIIHAVSGLTLVEVENAFAKSLVKTKTFDIKVITDEKKQVIRKSGILEYRDPQFTVDQIGGLHSLKEWIKTRKLAFTSDAREFGLPVPKGVLFVGIPGCGKSMTCDALAAEYQWPLLRLDFGALFASHIGESERNIRKAIEIAEVVSPCILWIDEIEKGVQGVDGSGSQTDGGVGARVFATLLTWMQEKKKMVFVACTANSVSGIPPEFMRAGRFDEVFFIDLPRTKEERAEVAEKILTKKKRNPDDFDTYLIAASSENYSPAEIEKGIDNALFVAYADNKRDLTTEDIVGQMGTFQPLYNTRKEEIEFLRKWAHGRARIANSTAGSKPIKKKRKKSLPKVPSRASLMDLDLG